MSDTFFAQQNKTAENDVSTKAMNPLSYASDITDDFVIEDSMNVDLEDQKNPIYEEYNKLLYQFYQAKAQTKKFEKVWALNDRLDVF
jgi:hypothetical protein